MSEVEVVTAISWMLCVGVKRTSAISGLGSTALRWSHRDRGEISSGIAEPSLVMMRVLSRFGGAAGVLVGVVVTGVLL